jgi:putative ABC transport system permease protein
MDAGNTIEKLESVFPEMDWSPRIKFGGLIDVPGEDGETRSQGPAMGMGIDLLSANTRDVERLNLRGSLARGRMPAEAGEALLSENFSQKLGVNPGEEITLIGSTMNGGMAIYNFKVAGTVRFGSTGMDRGTLVADITDVQLALDMEDAVGEILGYFPEGYYDDALALPVTESFKLNYPDSGDEYAPVMHTLRDQESMSMYIDLSKSMGALVTVFFMIAMSLVLWNAGLLGGLRRYGEIGVRLAIGEEKGHVYKTLIYESVMIGIAGTIVGTGIGLFFAWLMQEYGLDIGEFTKNASTSVMFPNVVHARITPTDYYIGFIPGVISTVVGTMLSGVGIYKRKTAQLFKELEA